MITNILATIIVSLSTNVVQSDNFHAVDKNIGLYWSCGVYGCTDDHTPKDIPATERYEDTVVTETKTITFEVEGDKWHGVKTREVSRTRKTLKLKTEWVPE